MTLRKQMEMNGCEELLKLISFFLLQKLNTIRNQIFFYFMSFPITAECWISSPKQAKPEQGVVFLYPLELTLYVNRQKNSTKLFKIAFSPKNSEEKLDKHSIFLSTGATTIKITCKSDIDHRSLLEMFEKLIPKTGFKSKYVMDLKVEWLSTENVQAFYCRNTQVHGLYFVSEYQYQIRIFSTLKPLQQLELIHQVNHRCCLKPFETYLQGEDLIVVYDYISAKPFRQMTFKINKFQTEQLSKFIIKVLFFCSHLQEMRIYIPNLEERFFLQNGHLNEPFLIDLSGSNLLKSNDDIGENSTDTDAEDLQNLQCLSSNPVNRDYTLQIGRMLYRIIFKSPFDQDNILKFRQQCGQLKEINPKLLDLLLSLLHVNQKPYTIAEALMHPWFKEIKFINLCKMLTIPSMNLPTMQTKSLRTMQSCNESDPDLNEGNILSNFMEKHVSNIKTPFSFKMQSEHEHN